jgi:hypothetical protein
LSRETIVVMGDAGVLVNHDIIVVNRIKVEIDCNCWGHRAPWPAEFVISKGGAAYVRCGTEGFYRTNDGIGPIRVTVIKGERESI